MTVTTTLYPPRYQDHASSAEGAEGAHNDDTNDTNDTGDTGGVDSCYGHSRDPDDDSVVLTALGARGVGTLISRQERARRTAQLLGLAAEATGEEREALLCDVVVLNCRVADAVARRFCDRGVPLEDLQQAAYEGLVKAVHRYDDTKAEDLLTFAVPTIRGEVQRHFRDRSWMVRPPRRVQELQGQISAAVADLVTVLGREPHAHEVCDHVGIDEREYAEGLAAFGCFNPPSLDRPVGEDGSATWGDLIADEREEHAAAETRCLLQQAMRDLSDLDRRVLYLTFVQERTQPQIGAELGLSKQQVCRRLERILRDLRRAVEPALQAC